MLGDVGDPQLVRVQSMEVSVDQIVGSDDPAQPLDPCRAGKPDNARLIHQQPHGALAHGDPHAQGELGVHAPVSVGAAGRDVDLADDSARGVVGFGVILGAYTSLLSMVATESVSLVS